MSKHIHQRRPITRAFTALAVAGLALSGCASGSGGGSDGADDTTASSDLGECGTVPVLEPNDPNGLLDGLSDEVKSAYNGYPLEIKESAWADWTPDHEGPFTAAMITNPPTNPFQVSLYDAIKKTLAENDVELIAEYAPANHQDVPQQLQQFEEAMSRDPDIIYFLPLAPEPSLEVIEAAGEAGIPVVVFQTPVDSEYALSVASNQVLQSMEVGAQVYEAMGGEGNLLRVAGVPGITSDTDALAGYNAALELCPGISIGGEVTGFFESGTAQAETLKYLSANPAPVDGVIHSGTMGLGVLNAFLESGREPVPIADIGALQGFISWALQNPDYPYVGTASPTARMGEAMAEVGIRTLHGEGPKVNQVITHPFIVNRDNIEEWGDESWDLADQTDFAGDPKAYFPGDSLDEFFNNPG
ncbi:substrate-binding domain-containing protein [Leucobacter tenebrionis]|uniref:substrate-binding domain-containing protein n=1 Tax=Leucobacter tenebrionis TaxID=2873270 RepID=UPI001CA67C84|nr:substrate-binding domain-containing protein [Leucobacter tenebrionis]QZY50642.1 substrate-binding domain-containing protein [Leucobacter tenebrionis]